MGRPSLHIPNAKSSRTLAIVAFEPSFTDALIPMWRQSFEAAVGIVDPHPLAAQRAYFLDDVVPHNAVRVVRDGERIVGFIAASRESIAQLYLAAGYSGRGIGTRLVDWAKAQSDGSLWLYTFARNRAACAFYERRGFRVAARGFEPHWQQDDVRYEWTAGPGGVMTGVAW